MVEVLVDSPWYDFQFVEERSTIDMICVFLSKHKNYTDKDIKKFAKEIGEDFEILKGMIRDYETGAIVENTYYE